MLGPRVVIPVVFVAFIGWFVVRPVVAHRGEIARFLQGGQVCRAHGLTVSRVEPDHIFCAKTIEVEVTL